MSTTTFVQQGDLIDYRATADVKAGDIIMLGETIGQVTTDALNGELVGLRVKHGAVINAPLAAGLGALTQGAILAWNGTDFDATPGAGKGVAQLAEPDGVADSPSGLVAVAINTGYSA